MRRALLWRNRPRRGDHEVEVLVPIVLEVNHAVVDPEYNLAAPHVVSEHSKAACWGIMFDLLQQAAVKTVVACFKDCSGSAALSYSITCA